MVINLVSGFHALGTLLGVGIMMVPAAIGRFWARDITRDDRDRGPGGGMLSGYAGLLLSFHTGVPVGARGHPGRGRRSMPSRSCSARVGGLVRQLFPGRHLEA